MKVDAKQELDNIINEEAESRFIDLILVPDGIDYNLMLDGERYYFTGDKGAGKTAMLIYTALQAEKLFNAERSFIIFKEISREERDDFKKMAHLSEYETTEFGDDYDYECVWRWVIHDNIAQTISSSERIIFEHDESLEMYLNAVDTIRTNPGKSKRRIPFIARDGYVELAVQTPGKIASLAGKINFEYKPDNTNQIRFSSLVNELDRLFMNLTDGESQLYIIIDEMNLSIANAIEYERDIMLVRDLVVTIEHMNLLSKQSHNNVRILGSIRNEVLNSISSKGKEINKAIESYGIPIDWTRYSSDKRDHPLIKLLINYLRISEKILGFQNDDSEENIYDRWVEDTIYHNPSEKLILDNTLYRPRHIVRLLNLAKLLCPKSNKINKSVMDAIRKQYSKECWTEVMEELAVQYSKEQLSLIQNLLTGIYSPTTRNQLFERAELNWKSTDVGQGLLSSFDDVLRSLYRAGIIGNKSDEDDPRKAKLRWFFRGDESLLLDLEIIIHRAFWPVLSVLSKYRNDVARY